MLVSDLKFLMRFNTSALYEEVSQTYMTVVGTEASPQMISGGGYVMQDDQYIFGEGIGFSGYSLSISGDMILGFWFYSVNPGTATSDDGSSVSISMPIINFNEIGSNDISVLDIKDNTTADGDNYLTVSFDDGAYIASSEDYDPDRWHFLWMVYSSGYLDIYIDGKKQTLQNVSGSLPTEISGANLDVYINHSLAGYDTNIAKNYGYISDIFVFNSSDKTLVDMQTAINDGIKYIVDDTFTSTNIEKASIYFDDPTTVTVTSSVDDMSYIYLGRNDGKILRGSSLLWESRKDYSNAKEADALNVTYYNDPIVEDENNISGGFLTLKDKVIEL